MPRQQPSFNAHNGFSAGRAPEDELLGKILLCSVSFYTAILLLSSLGFMLGFGMSRDQIIIAVSTCTAGLLSYGYKTNSIRMLLVALSAVIFSIYIAVWLSQKVLDLSWDGMSYHQVSVVALSSGWNPLTQPRVLDWWLGSFPEKMWLANLTYGGMWTDHYPKASWILGAAITLATHSLNASKWLQLHLALLAIVASYRTFRLMGVHAPVAALAASAAALSPVVIAQLLTNYVDGILGCALLIQISALLAWQLRRSSIDLYIAIAISMVAVNLKFTGAVYAILILVILLGSGLLQNRRISQVELWLGLCGFLLLMVTSFHPYVTNWWVNGSVFYPVNVIPFMATQSDPTFVPMNRWMKFIYTTFLQVPSIDLVRFSDVAIAFPRLWHYKLLASVTDLRVGGFGTMFGWSLVCSVSAALYFSLRYTNEILNNKIIRSIFLVILAIFVSVFINPEFWWARYVPQLWLVPIFVFVMFYITRRYILSLVLLAPVVLGSFLTAAFWLVPITTSGPPNSTLVSTWREAQRTGHVHVLRAAGSDWTLLTFWHQMRDLNITVYPVDERSVEEGLTCGSAGMVIVCHK